MELNQTAVFIAATLYHHDRRDNLPPKPIAKHVKMIRDRVQLLRKDHPDGLEGAELQARSEWVTAVLLTPQEKVDETPS